MTRNGPHQRTKPETPKRDWRRIHHSPLFWVGVLMFLAAIMTYVFSEDLSLRPRMHRSAQRSEGRLSSALAGPKTIEAVYAGRIHRQREPQGRFTA